MGLSLRRRLAVPASLLSPCWRLAPALPGALFAVSVSTVAVPTARAQDENAAASASATTSADEVVTLDPLSVSAAEADVYDVLPTRPTSSVFGTDQTLQDTARSVTLIESNLIDLYGIDDVNDFVALTAGTFTGNYFGVPGALDVRGERADNFFRGFRRVENRGNFPTIVGGTDYVEIIKGPPPPVYGGGKVGGILNFIPKTAKSKTAQLIEKPTGLASVTVGTYDKKIGSIEYGLPFALFGKKSGAYVYLQSEDSESFYDNVYRKGTLGQLSIDTALNDTTRLEYGTMVQYADLNQSLGWNRVTQRMIDTEGEYLSGQPALNLDTDGNGFISPAELTPFGLNGGRRLEQFAFADPFPYFALPPQQRAAFALGPTRTVMLDHDTVQAEREDFSETWAYTGFFDVIKDLTPDLKLKNQTFYDSMNHTKYSSYGFTADYTAYVFENKTTVDWKTQPADSLDLNLIGGLSYRFSDGDEKESRGRGFQVLDRRDIYLGAIGNTRFEGAHTGTGNVPYNWVQQGEFSDTGLFALVDTTYVEKLSLVLSGRYDYYDATTSGTDIGGVYDKADADDTSATYNSSLSYKLFPSITAYITHAESTYLELGQGGMIARENLQNGTWLQDSQISEVGVKTTLLQDRLFATLAYYEQEKSAFNNLSGTFDDYESKGTELEIRYAPTREWSFTAAATWQKTVLTNPPFFLGIPPSALGLNPAQVYGGRFVGVGTILGLGNENQTPTPEEVYSIGATYTNPSGWGASLGTTYVSSMFSGYLQQIKLPDYFVTRAALFYNCKNWSFRLNGNNILNEKYYTPQFLFWDTFISPSQGPTYDLTATYKF
jgi:iron complex outermembrane receptor protein